MAHKLRKAEFEYNNGDKWEVVDSRNDKVVGTAKNGSMAKAKVIYFDEQLAKAEKFWEGK